MEISTNNSRGFSLIEVMTALALGLVVVLMVVQLFINAKNNHAQNDRVSETLESGRYALRQIATDLKNAGNFGGVLDTSAIKVDGTLGTLSSSNDCGASGQTNWAYDVDTYRSVQYDDASINTSISPPTDHTCIKSTNYNTGTDALVVKRVFNNPYTTSPASTLTTNSVYLRSDFNSACLWYYSSSSTSPSGSNCPSVSTNTFDWPYRVNVYYIRNYYQTPGDGIPTLCRESLEGSSGPGMTEVCLAPGIEAFHVMFGIDTDSTYDGIANKYVSNPTATELRDRVVSARIYVLARSLLPDSKLKDTKKYILGDKTITANDKYYRRLYSTTVLMRNPMYAGLFN